MKPHHKRIKNNLIDSAVNRVLSGESKHHKGWVLPDAELVYDYSEVTKKLPSSFLFKTKDGLIVEVDNLTRFCEEQGFPKTARSKLSKVVNGSRKQYRGFLKY